MKQRGVVLIFMALGACCLAFGQDNTILAPNVLNLVVGETHSIQALDPAGQPVTGLTWTSGDPTVVSLSTDDPPVLLALAAGHVTITAGTATADVTVSTGSLPLGTVIWSNPGSGSGVYSIVPAVPSPSGVADVFAFQNDGTVQAITSDGATAWTADVSNAWPVLPDFQGGLVAVSYDGNGSIVKLDGMTGQPYAVYTPPDPSSYLYGGYIGVHTDGTVFTVLGTDDPNGLAPPQYSVIGIDPITGSQKFSVPLPQSDSSWGRVNVLGLTIAGDGYAYVPFSNRELSGLQELNHLALLRVNSSGDYEEAPIFDWTSVIEDFVPIGEVHMVTNADTGILLTWGSCPGDSDDPYAGYGVHMTITTGVSAGAVITPALPGNPEALAPVLQAQDGSFVGRVRDMDTWEWTMIAFDQSGSVSWSVAGEQPWIATDDGGVIAQSGTIYDQGGSATGQIQNLAAYSWLGNSYEIGSTDQFLANMLHVAVSWWPFAGANPSGNYTAVKQPWFAPLQSCPGASTPCPLEAILSANQALKSLIQAPCPACISWVFNKLAGTDQTSFQKFLSRPPRFWDGTRSYAPQNVAFCPSGAWNQSFGCDYSWFDTVHDYFTQNTTRDAASQTPADEGKGMRVFFKPATGICNVLSVLNPQSGDQGVVNQAILFHEALHGYTGKFDIPLKNAFGIPYPLTAPSALITQYLQGHVIFGQGASACTN